MGFIIFRCTSCNLGLKVGADKAGRKIKCSKCGTILTIPAAEPEDDQSPVPAELPAATPPKNDDEEEDVGKAYGLIHQPAPDDEQKDKVEDKPKKNEIKPPPIQRKFKSLPEPELWEKVKGGLQVLMISGYIWAGSVLFLGIILYLCIMSGPEYAELIEDAMPKDIEPVPGVVQLPHMPTFMLNLVVGKANHGTAKTLCTLVALLSILQSIVLLAGCGICLKIPDRFGTQGQLKALLVLSVINLFAVLILKLLPSLGSSQYFLVPYAMPEVSLVDANLDRLRPLWVFWSPSPFWEMILNVLILFAFYAQPVLLGVFIWSIGMALKEDPIIRQGQGIVSMALGIGFALLSFNLLSMTGTSGVALGVLRVVYGGWFCFTILLLIRLPMALQATRNIIQGYLDGAEIKDDEDEAEEEEEKPKRKRKAKKRPKDEDDDE